MPVEHRRDIVMHNNGKDTLTMERGWRTGDIDKDSGFSEMRLLGNSQLSSLQGNYAECGTDYAEIDPLNMTTFYNCRTSPENPTPYATTMLINPNQNSMGSNPSHSSSGTSSLHSDGKQQHFVHPTKYYPGQGENIV